MYKIVVLFFISFLIAIFQSTAYSQEQDVKIYIDSKELDIESVFENDHILVPMRAISESLGASVAWSQETLSAEVSKGDSLIFVVDRNKMFKNGVVISIDTPAQLINNRLFVPLRALAEGLNLDVDWNSENSIAFIKTDSLSISTYKMPEGPEPYYVLFEWLFQHSCGMNFGIKYIAIDLTESTNINYSGFIRLMTTFCEENGFTLLEDTHDSLLKKGLILQRRSNVRSKIKKKALKK